MTEKERVRLGEEAKRIGKERGNNYFYTAIDLFSSTEPVKYRIECLELQIQKNSDLPLAIAVRDTIIALRKRFQV